MEDYGVNQIFWILWPFMVIDCFYIKQEGKPINKNNEEVENESYLMGT